MSALLRDPADEDQSFLAWPMFAPESRSNLSTCEKLRPYRTLPRYEIRTDEGLTRRDNLTHTHTHTLNPRIFGEGGGRVYPPPSTALWRSKGDVSKLPRKRNFDKWIVRDRPSQKPSMLKYVRSTLHVLFRNAVLFSYFI